MERRRFGRTGLELGVLGFGCGAVGGLMVRGTPADQERTVARALEAGVDYFDTAVQYGNGESERNVGRVLRRLKPAAAVVGTKVRVPSRDFGRIPAAIVESLDGSLGRLGLERVDILYLHNPVTVAGGGETFSEGQVLEEAVPALLRLRDAGKIRFLGMTAVGETAALRAVLDAGAFDAAQVVYNMLNPSAATPLPAGHPGQDYGRILDRGGPDGVGAVAIRVLAGGALSGSMERHPIAGAAPAPIGSSATYDEDVALARRLEPLVAEGFARSLAEAAIRFAIAEPRIGPILVGMATPEQFDQALAAVQQGPLPPAALDRLAALRGGFAGSRSHL
ncbi:MAG: aldo/keto reductase [Alphaproteobacteria bacterium]